MGTGSAFKTSRTSRRSSYQDFHQKEYERCQHVMWSSAALRATSTTFPEVQTFTRRNLRGEKLIVHDVSEGGLCENFGIYRVFEGVLCEHTIIYDACQSLII